MQLLNKTARVSRSPKASTVGNVRIIDSAEAASKPVKTEKKC
ncbi:hypothetical protein M8494_17405 [Serratia ureilytica]